MGNMTWPEKLNSETKRFFFVALVPVGRVEKKERRKPGRRVKETGGIF